MSVYNSDIMLEVSTWFSISLIERVEVYNDPNVRQYFNEGSPEEIRTLVNIAANAAEFGLNANDIKNSARELIVQQQQQQTASTEMSVADKAKASIQNIVNSVPEAKTASQLSKILNTKKNEGDLKAQEQLETLSNAVQTLGKEGFNKAIKEAFVKRDVTGISKEVENLVSAPSDTESVSSPDSAIAKGHDQSKEGPSM